MINPRILLRRTVLCVLQIGLQGDKIRNAENVIIETR